MGLEEIIGPAVAGGIALDGIEAERAKAAAHVTDEVRRAGLDLDAGGGAAIGGAGCEAQLVLDEASCPSFVGEFPAVGGE
jgi:hypothetical protein